MRKRELESLRRKCEQARYEMQQHPEDWVGTWEDLFSSAPEGDFKWDGSECACDRDMVPFETDSESGWSYNFHSMTLGRKDGREFVEFHTQWACGDHDTEGPYYKEDQDNPDFVYHMMTQHCGYSLLKTYLYDIYCAETGLDPLENCMMFDLNRRAGNQHITCYVRYRPTVAGYRVQKSRMHGHSWKRRMSGLPGEVRHFLDDRVLKTDKDLYEIYCQLFAGEKTCKVGHKSAGQVWELVVEKGCYMTLKISGEIPKELPNVTYEKEIKRISARHLKERIASTLEFIKKWRRPKEQEVHSELG